jgi:hypothetical protein
VSFDQSAVVAVYRLPVASLNPDRPELPRFVAIPHVFPVKTPLRDVVDFVVDKGACASHLSIEINGVAAMPAEEIRRALVGTGDRHVWNLVHTTNATKTAGYGGILGLLEREQLVLPRHPQLLRQLAGLRFEQGERGFTRIEAENPAVHDDVADSLMLAAMPYRPENSRRIRCHISRLASPEHAWPDSDLPERFGGEVIETGGGLRVWTRPPLQSANGSELTLSRSSIQPREPRRIGDFVLNPHPERTYS